jgi:hypothetical protein
MVNAAALLALVLAASCHGGGGAQALTISSINFNPATPAAGSVVELTASITAPGQNPDSLTKSWTVSAGTVSTTQPDFALILRQTAKGASASSVSTAAKTVYWVTPAAGGSATITLTVGTASKQRTVQLGASPVRMSVTDGTGGQKICTVQASNVQDLYQAAFRINFSSAWTPVSAAQGTFLGAAGNTLWIGLTNQNGFVPCALTKRGNVAGTDGSGTLATVTFAPAHAGSAADSQTESPFELTLVILRDSQDQPIALD